MLGHSGNKTTNAVASSQVNPPAVFHDFLGGGGGGDGGGSRGCDPFQPVNLAPKNIKLATPGVDVTADQVVKLSEPSPSASGSAGGGRGPFSSTSDLGSVSPSTMVERQVGNPFKRTGCYSPRSDLSLPEVNNRLVGSKRSNSDSGFMWVSTECLPQMGLESPESSHFIKMLRQGAGGEQHQTLHHDGHFHGMQQMRPGFASLMLQKISGGHKDGDFSKWEQSIPINVGGSMQYTPHSGHASPLSYQSPSSRLRDVCAGPSILSHAAADEGSRTGMKGSEILSSINTSYGLLEKNVCAIQGRSKAKTTVPNSEPESSNPPSRLGLTSASRQMTIIYGGQVHVFDDVHPNKVC
ncbi:hypothetical protein Dimus_010328 [Dionaea muscipula]